MKKDEAIEILENTHFFGSSQDDIDTAIEMAINALERELKTGHWIPLGDYDDYGNESSYKCSECGDIDTCLDNYCPNCGTKME